MTHVVVQKQVHGYRRGHQLLSASVELVSRDQDVVNRLSDLAGPLRPGELFDPYLTGYPLPSGRYYVLVRTFQDLAASRSGCVQTNSALIPMAAWEGITSLDGVLAELSEANPDDIAVECEVPVEGPTPRQVVNGGGLVDLVDAVFRDSRPVVCFDCREAEAIALRLMVALWPTARRRFSLCTFVLGPRRLEEHFFDLVFAPLDARSRFVGLGHRSLGGSERPGYTQDDSSRSWAEPAARRIFQSDDPGLSRWDPLGLLGAAGSDSRTSLRALSLWNALASRAENAPTAVLGMIDILRSREVKLEDATWPNLEGTVLRAIGAAGRDLSGEEAWGVLFALEEKTGGGWATAKVQKGIEESAGVLASRGPRDALAVVAADPMRRMATVHVARGLADGVGRSPMLRHLADDVARLPSFAVAQLMASSLHFARGVIEGMNSDVGQWSDILGGAFEAANQTDRRGMRRAMLTIAEGLALERAVPGVLEDVACEELSELVTQAIDRRVGESPAVNRALWNAARVGGCEASVRDAAMRSADRTRGEQFVLSTLALNSVDVEWLARRGEDERAASRLLSGLLRRVRDEEIRGLSRSTAGQVLELLGTELDACKEEVARVLALGVGGGEAAFDLGARTLAVVRRRKTRNELGEWMVRAGLVDAQPGDVRVNTVLAEFGVRLAASELVDAATSSRAKGARIGSNLVALDASPSGVRSRVLERLERMSERLVARPREDLGREGYGAWASMIRDVAGMADPEAEYRVARTVLQFALPLRERAVSGLIMETFPLVYGHLPKTEEHRRIGQGESLFSSYYHWWMGLDEWEGPRKRAIGELVRAFMKSAWPAADLLVTALKADVAKKVVKRVRGEMGGVRYIDEIGRDARRLRKRMRARVLKCLEPGVDG